MKIKKFYEKEKSDNLKNQVQEMENGIRELSESTLDQVNGAGNPFEDVPRVPTQPIDDDLRNKA